MSQKKVAKKHWSEHVSRKCFMPHEYQIELFQAVLDKNIIVCTENSTDKSFISLKVIQEFGFRVRQSEKLMLLAIESEETGLAQSACMKNQSDLNINHLYSLNSDVDIPELLKKTQVLVASSKILIDLFTCSYIEAEQVSVLMLNECHLMLVQGHSMQQLINIFTNVLDQVRIVGFTLPLFIKGTNNPGKVVACAEKLQELTNASIETANDILANLKYCSKSTELVVEHIENLEQVSYKSLSDKLEKCILYLLEYFENHNYNLLDIYSEFEDEVKNISNPSEEPRNLIQDFLIILKTMGPWCADKVALHILCKLHRLQTTACYERHFLLLILLQTEMVKIRKICEDVFKTMDEKEALYKFVSPKVLRLIELFKQYKPKCSPDDELFTEMTQKKVILDTKDLIALKVSGNKISKVDIVEENSLDKNSKDTFVYVGRDRGQEKKTTPPNPGDKAVSSAKLTMSFAKFVRTSCFSFDNFEHFCSLLIVESDMIARVLFNIVSELRKVDFEFWWLTPQFILLQESDKHSDTSKRVEDVLKKFRTRECNILIGTCLLEQGYDLPKCNLVIRFEPCSTYKTYVQSKVAGLKKSSHVHDSYFVMFSSSLELHDELNNNARYQLINQILFNFCSNKTPKSEEQLEADKFSSSVKPFRPDKDKDNAIQVTMENAIYVVNRYCARLPSDIFTRLAPIITLHEVEENDSIMYTCSIRLPINSPLKQTVTGHKMPTKLLAGRIAAMETCRALYELKELDKDLMPIAKESMNLYDMNLYETLAPKTENDNYTDSSKRRQFYHKRMASCFTNCRPSANVPCYLYAITMKLTCPIPDEQNKRGRKIHPPEESPQGLAILTTKSIPKVCAFPIFTRSGEVEISIELIDNNVNLSQENLSCTLTFMDYLFTKVLKLKKYLMLFDANCSENSYFIVPTLSNAQKTFIDWDFMELINKHSNDIIQDIPEEERRNFVFDEEKFRDAVVMPWYRNQFEPTYFYVAEIMTNVHPRSVFPSRTNTYQTFEEYYSVKYGLQIQKIEQPLLDVDHTSCRLNFLTPRYVNRKGINLATTSEETRREIRESLGKKQLLVPELVLIHPFPASLWRKSVSLPSILYRLNALLLADEIRTAVALGIGLGKVTLDENTEWPPFNFGWKMKKLKEKYGWDIKTGSDETKAIEQTECVAETELCTEVARLEIAENTEPVIEIEQKEETDEDSKDKQLENDTEKESQEPWVEIGTWSNEMAAGMECKPGHMTPPMFSDDEDSNDDLSSVDFDLDYDDDFRKNEKEDTLQIQFKGKYSAEAICEDDDNSVANSQAWIESNFFWEEIDANHINSDLEFVKVIEEKLAYYDEQMKIIKDRIEASNTIKKDQPVQIVRQSFTNSSNISKNALFSEILENINKLNTYGSVDKNVFADSCRRFSECGIIRETETPDFSFDFQPDLENHTGPCPSILLQALTMSNANDGINLERLETIGDSFLKYAITIYLYCTYPNVHEGKLSHLRSKQVSNFNLFKLGKLKVLGESMIATKFEPRDNWLPPGYFVPKNLEKALIEAGFPASLWHCLSLPNLKEFSEEKVKEIIKQKCVDFDCTPDLNVQTVIPYNLVTQHSIPDKSIADSVEALIGAYLIECGPRGALLFMSWLGLRVLPANANSESKLHTGYLQCPPSPLNKHIDNAQAYLDVLLDGFDKFEETINYRFKDKSYLLQAMTHASYFLNTLTDCYQRLEFLGDAILDYLITRHLYEDERTHSPGTLTDLRSALVNNIIFASLAVRLGFHHFFKHLSSGLHEVIQRFVKMQSKNDFTLNQEYYLMEGECDEAEDIEVPKALGDLFESVAGAIYLDSGMSLDTVWKVYYEIMKSEIERLSVNVPKSPIRELLELEPENARFSKPEKLADGRRVRVTVEVFGKGSFKGVGRNYCIAKCTAAKCALKHLKSINPTDGK
uniref:ribonuclease III n=1 Tax=Cacopsylla melanoneura TaxID=428564 RepID=A0A8D8QUE6_9HEMI